MTTVAAKSAAGTSAAHQTGRRQRVAVPPIGAPSIFAGGTVSAAVI